MTGVFRTTQIDLRFGNSACEFLDFGVGARPGKLARQRLDLFR